MKFLAKRNLMSSRSAAGGLHRWVLAVVLAGCGAAQIMEPPAPKTSSSVLASMTGYKTYAYDASAPAPPGDAQWSGTQAQIAKVKEQIDHAMQAKGYVLSPKPQLLVRISLGLKTTTDPTAVRGATSSTVNEEDLDLDLFEYPSGEHLFHGTASDLLREQDPSQSKIAGAVPAILEPVPPASS